MKKNNKQLFSGYIREPWSIVVVYCIILTLFLAVAIAFSLKAYNEQKEHSLISSEEVFLSCKVEERSLTLLSETDRVFSIVRTSDADEEAIKEFVDNGESLNVWYYSRNEADPAVCVIEAIYDHNGVPVVSDRAIKAATTRSSILALSIVWGIFAAFLLFGIIGYKALSNAPKHPILVGLLVRKEFRNF